MTAAVRADRRYVRGRRCPVCGGADTDPRGAERRCFGFLSSDGKYAHCSREEHAGSIARSPSDTYGHRLAGSCACGTQHGPARAPDLGTVVATYDYRDEAGALVYQVVRFAPKAFRQRRPDPEAPDRWIWKLGDTRRVLYRLDRVLESEPTQTVYVVEGEADVESLETLGLVATCNPQGAGKWKHVADCAARALAERHVVVIADADDPGRKHAADVRRWLRGVAASVRVIELPCKDAADWVADGGTVEALEAIIADNEAHAAGPGPDGGEHEVSGEDEPERDSDAEPMKPRKPRGTRDGVVGLAIDYVARFASHPDGSTLRRWRGDWYRWTSDRGYYAAVGDERIDASLYRDFKLTRPQDVRDVRHALIAADGVLIDEVQIGDWIGEPMVSHSPLDITACPNGLLHLRSRSLTRPTPRYFATTSLGVAYDPVAPVPARWLAFLRQLWPQDDQSIAALQEWFGYMLTPDTRQQKIMLLVGPKRSGKGTIMRVLKALLGDDSVAAPTLASLGTNFGLWPLIGKTAAIIGDARLGGRSDIAQIVERLLSVSGQDPQTIDRKHREPWTGYLSARMTIVSNELPRFTDASDALASRMLILELEESFYGREDTTLTDALRGELSGILQWAIDGWDRLRLRGRFEQPTASAELVNDLADLASPVAAWIRERCEKGSGQVDCDVAYKDYASWCASEGHHHRVTSTTFGRDLKAAAQIKRVQVRNGLARSRVYQGIRLRS